MGGEGIKIKEYDFGGIVTHGHAQPQAVAKLALELCFPQPGTTPMTSPRLRQDQEIPGLGYKAAPDVRPPVCNRRDSKLWRIRRGAHIDGTHMALRIVDPIRHRASERVAREVMHVDLDGLADTSLAGVLEVPNQFLLLGVHPDDREPAAAKRLFLRFNVVELRVVVRMVRPRFLLLRINAQRVVVLFQQAADGRRAHRIPPLAPAR